MRRGGTDGQPNGNRLAGDRIQCHSGAGGAIPSLLLCPDKRLRAMKGRWSLDGDLSSLWLLGPAAMSRPNRVQVVRGGPRRAELPGARPGHCDNPDDTGPHACRKARGGGWCPDAQLRTASEPTQTGTTAPAVAHLGLGLGLGVLRPQLERGSLAARCGRQWTVTPGQSRQRMRSHSLGSHALAHFRRRLRLLPLPETSEAAPVSRGSLGTETYLSLELGLSRSVAFLGTGRSENRRRG